LWFWDQAVCPAGSKKMPTDSNQTVSPLQFGTIVSAAPRNLEQQAQAVCSDAADCARYDLPWHR